MRTHRIRLAAAGLLALAPLLLAGCGSDDPPADTGSDTGSDTSSSASDGGGETTEATITISDFAYGDPLTVAPGTEVTVVNEDPAAHNANDADGAFEEPLISQGESATFTAPEEPGTYDLICTAHEQMSGQLIVEG
ncbi:MAG: cupredoxin domain-containing protein [Geodermatophilaceae bacterium]|nr:cupredoxin domain-containing protein [Geodermatophilaceae bacterium]